jgi:hypothetical protein
MNHCTMSVDVNGEVWGVLHYDLEADTNYVAGIVIAVQNILSASWGA